jgi:hypothetical protein
MRIGYLDCFSGVSGDMLLGAFLDAGAPEECLRSAADLLGLPGPDLEVTRTGASGLSATRVRIRVPEEKTHRRLADIEKLLASGSLPGRVREKSLAVFRRLAEAEAAVHGSLPEEVHFHEVGAADAIIDIVGVVSCLFSLNIGKLFCSPLPVSRGWAKCAHGDLPLPGPAVYRLLQQGVPIYGENLEQELVTPTGAALVMELVEDFGPLPPMRLSHCGYGTGKSVRMDGRPNLLRLVLGEEYRPGEAQRVTVIETSLDDWSPETWPHVQERLFAGGALDVVLAPVHMKKGRPGFILTVVCDPAHAFPLQQAIFAETSAIGIRFHNEQRVTLPRQEVTVQTEWGPVRAKMIEKGEGHVITPEYEECRRVAAEHDLPVSTVYRAVTRLTGE